MTRRVWACDACGEEAAREDAFCAICGGVIEKVDPLIVALADGLDAIVRAITREP